jgi:A/G-specific adenine glycosylase
LNRRENILSSEEVARFQTKIYGYYREHARDLPWRRTNNAYHIFVSEIMLQQTQVGRVIEKYAEFIETFPSFSVLADSSLSDVLFVWQGLGYNRRAFSLLKAARIVTSRHGGEIPMTVEELSLLPGVGKATASAVLVFAFGVPLSFIETNIRRVFIDQFFPGNEVVGDSDILPLVEQALDGTDPRNWYYALMDYGSMMGKRASSSNPNRKSLHYRRQTPFKDSDRKIRGAVLGMLLKDPFLPASEIAVRSGVDPERVGYVLGCLEKEGLVCENTGVYAISES